MRLITTSYTAQNTRLPKIGRYILAQFDEEGVIVYQAYRPAIGDFAATQDISQFVREQYQNIGDYNKLIVPSETIYPVTDPKVAAQLQLSSDAILPPNGNTNEL